MIKKDFVKNPIKIKFNRKYLEFYCFFIFFRLLYTIKIRNNISKLITSHV